MMTLTITTLPLDVLFVILSRLPDEIDRQCLRHACAAFYRSLPPPPTSTTRASIWLDRDAQKFFYTRILLSHVRKRKAGGWFVCWTCCKVKKHPESLGAFKLSREKAMLEKKRIVCLRCVGGQTVWRGAL